MRKFLVECSPYVTQYGYINVPDTIDNPRKFIENNWEKINWELPELDYCGIDFEAEPID